MKLKSHKNIVEKPSEEEGGVEKIIREEIKMEHPYQEKRLHLDQSVRNKLGFWKGFFIFWERFIALSLKIAVGFWASLFFLAASFYLVTSAFDLKQSPAFIEVRDKMALIYAHRVEEVMEWMEPRRDFDLDEERYFTRPQSGEEEMKNDEKQENSEENEEEKQNEDPNNEQTTSPNIQEQGESQNSDRENLESEIQTMEKELEEKKAALDKVEAEL